MMRAQIAISLFATSTFVLSLIWLIGQISALANPNTKATYANKLIRIIKPAILLMSLVASLYVFFYAIRPIVLFDTYHLSSDSICEMRIDVYAHSERTGASESTKWQLAKSMYVTSQEHIDTTVALMDNGEYYMISHESLVGTRYHIRFRECDTSEWKDEQIIITTDTTRNQNVYLTSFRLSIVSVMSDNTSMSNSIGSKVVANSGLGQWVDHLVKSNLGRVVDYSTE